MHIFNLLLGPISFIEQCIPMNMGHVGFVGFFGNVCRTISGSILRGNMLSEPKDMVWNVRFFQICRATNWTGSMEVLRVRTVELAHTIYYWPVNFCNSHRSVSLKLALVAFDQFCIKREDRISYIELK